MRGALAEETDGSLFTDLSQALRDVNASPSEEYFDTLVRELALHFGVARAFVAELIDCKPLRARTIARYGDGGPLPNGEYYLEGMGTLSLEVVGRGFKLGPAGALNVRHGVASYVGVSLFDHDGALMGWLAVASREPIADEQATWATLQYFAARTEAELHRIRLQSALRRETLHRRSAEERALRVMNDAMHDDLTLLPKRTLFLE